MIPSNRPAPSFPRHWSLLRLCFHVVLFCTASAAIADDSFRYYVFDTTKTDKLHYEHVHDFIIYDKARSSPRLVFSTEYRIYGCAEGSFTYTTEHCARNVPRERLRKFIASVREFPLKNLHGNKKRGYKDGSSSGWLELDKSNLWVDAPLHHPERARLHALVLTFLNEVAPKATRKRVSRTIEGDFVPARPVTFETLLRTPKQFAGKRVRLVGYYHEEFEGSDFGPSRNAGYETSVWLGEDSTFATPSKKKRPNDTFITVEGTFDAGAGGHMGLWAGEINRVTRIQKVKP